MTFSSQSCIHATLVGYLVGVGGRCPSFSFHVIFVLVFIFSFILIWVSVSSSLLYQLFVFRDLRFCDLSSLFCHFVVLLAV